MKSLTVAFLFIVVIAFANAQNNKRTLVLLDNWSVRETHSIFFKSLKDRGHKLTYKTATDSSLQLVQYGELLFDNIVLFAPTVREFGGKLDVKTLLEYVDAGGNVLVTANDKTGEAVLKFATECGVEIDEENTAFIDHWNYDQKDDGKHTLVVVDSKNLIPVNVIAGDTPSSPLLYRGVGMSNDVDNPLLLSILHGSPTAYSYSLESSAVTEYPVAIGTSSQLITGLQARNMARIVFSGSLDFFSDELFTSSVKNVVTGETYSQSGNLALSEALTRWVFQESGVLRVSNVTHRKLSSSDSSGHLLEEESNLLDTSDYTIMDEVEYSANIEELVDADPLGRTQVWVPYKAKDVQMEFVRIDPFVRVYMKKNAEDRYFLRFKLPDVYGVFKFLIDYNRAGYTRIHSVTQVSVRPLRHTQYERYIEAAYPYYTSAFSMMIGVVLFSIFFLHYRPSGKNKSE